MLRGTKNVNSPKIRSVSFDVRSTNGAKSRQATLFRSASLEKSSAEVVTRSHMPPAVLAIAFELGFGFGGWGESEVVLVAGGYEVAEDGVRL